MFLVLQKDEPQKEIRYPLQNINFIIYNRDPEDNNPGTFEIFFKDCNKKLEINKNDENYLINWANLDILLVNLDSKNNECGEFRTFCFNISDWEKIYIFNTSIKRIVNDSEITRIYLYQNISLFLIKHFYVLILKESRSSPISEEIILKQSKRDLTNWNINSHVYERVMAKL